MLRRLAVITLALSSLALPSRAAAGEGGAPLRTLCSSPTMDYCASFWTIEMTYTDVYDARYPWYRLAHSVFPFELFGAEVTSETIFRTALFTGEAPDGSGIGDWHETLRMGLGFHTGMDNSPAAYPYEPTPADVIYVSFDNGASGALCSGGGGGITFPGVEPCYEPTSVPEPGSLLLLAAGLAMLATKRRRA